ncbi:Retrovirus-related Pol polyprotein from transposon 17.6, partial [Mucuna pruriens]
MPGLDTTIVEHRLPLIPNVIPFRRMKSEVALKIKEEVEKQWNAGFLTVAEYPQWVANIVPIPKKDGKGKPKGQFPPTSHRYVGRQHHSNAFYSSMDDFSRYNQIQMVVEDRKKLPSSPRGKHSTTKLKNARAAYQRAMVTLFHDMMHKEVEAYVDDMIAMSRMSDQHVEDLRKLFKRLRKYRLRINLAKCTFGVKIGKLLGFIVNQRGIEVDLDKVKAIRNMSPPKTKIEVRGFLRRVNYIAKFISQLTATCSPIFKLLRKSQKMEWTEEFQEAFEKVKQYVEAPPILVSATPGKPLILYLTVLEE